METYKVVRYFMSRPKRTVRTGLTLEEAQEHCRDPETSSSTCTSPEGVKRTQTYGSWFDGYEKE